MKHPLISVIIPVYNSRPYIEICLNSLLNQISKEVELIIVNDGSCDGSADICEKYSRENKNIKIFHQANSGVAAARNKGLLAARGQWITFVDSDDWVASDYFDRIIRLVNNTDAEVIRFGYYQVANSVVEKKVIPDRLYLTSKEDMLVRNNQCAYYAMLWNSLIRRNVIDEIKFDEDLKWSEDYVFMYKIYKRCGAMLLDNSALYYYRKNSTGSLSTCSDPCMIRKAIDRGLILKLSLVQSVVHKKRIIREYHFWARQALRYLYKNRHTYSYRKEYSKKYPLLEYDNASSLEKVFFNNSLLFIFRESVCRLYYILAMIKGKFSLK